MCSISAVHERVPDIGACKKFHDRFAKKQYGPISRIHQFLRIRLFHASWVLPISARELLSSRHYEKITAVARTARCTACGRFGLASVMVFLRPS